MPLHPPRATRWLLGIAGGLLVIAVAGVAAFIATFDVNRLIAPGQGHVKAVTGRDLLIRGGATLEISLHPRLVASDVSISNWAGAGSAGDGKAGCRAAPPSAAIVGTLRGDSSRTG